MDRITAQHFHGEIYIFLLQVVGIELCSCVFIICYLAIQHNTGTATILTSRTNTLQSHRASMYFKHSFALSVSLL